MKFLKITMACTITLVIPVQEEFDLETFGDGSDMVADLKKQYSGLTQPDGSRVDMPDCTVSSIELREV